eukprot:1379930-Rhodomonas_salina.3
MRRLLPLFLSLSPAAYHGKTFSIRCQREYAHLFGKYPTRGRRLTPAQSPSAETGDDVGSDKGCQQGWQKGRNQAFPHIMNALQNVHRPRRLVQELANGLPFASGAPQE